MKTPFIRLKVKVNSILNSVAVCFFSRLDYHIQKTQKNNMLKHIKSYGNNVFIQMPVHINGVENIELGDNVAIAAFVHMWGEGGIKVGKRVMIASHTAITSLTHDYNRETMQGTVIRGNVTIEDDVWIGAHSVIMPGITIGKGAVVGAGSVVTKDVEPYSIVMGVPARLYKQRKPEGP